MTVELKWNMQSLSKEAFVEKIDNESMRQGDRYCGWGTYYANLAWVFCIANGIVLEDDYEREQEWNELCKFINVDYDKSRYSKISIACEAVNKISTSIYSTVLYCVNHPLKKSSRSKAIYKNKRENVSEPILFSLLFVIAGFMP